MPLLWVIVALAAAFAAVNTFLAVMTATGAPQQAAAAGVGLAIAVIPYVFVRAIGLIFALRRKDVHAAMLDALRDSRRETLDELRHKDVAAPGDERLAKPR